MASADRSPYNRVTKRMWSDKKFCSLSPMLPSAQSLWLYLLTGPHTSPIPGLFILGELTLADALGWDPADVRRCLQEILDCGMARLDKRRRLMWLPNALAHNMPQNPNQVIGWEPAWEQLPECDLLREAAAAIVVALAAKSSPIAKAFADMSGAAYPPPKGATRPTEPLGERFVEPLPEPFEGGSPHGSGNTETYTETDPEISSSSSAGARTGIRGSGPSACVAHERVAAAAPVLADASPSQSPALPTSRASNGQSDADQQRAVAAHACPDLLTMARELADAGNGYGRQMLDWAAQGKVFRPGQRETIRKLYAEYVEGRALAVRASAIRADQAPPTPRAGPEADHETPISPDWKPDRASYDVGKTLGFQRGRVDFEAERFVSSSLEKGRRSHRWDQAFANWLRNARTFDERDGRTPQMPTEANSKPIEEQQLVGLMDHLRRIKPGECVR